MTNYEVLYIVSPKMEEAAREELIARFAGVVTAAGGTAEVNKWGMRKLAYKIDFMSEGYYVLMTFTGPSDLPAELESQMRISDAVMRFVTTKKVENKLTRAEAERKAKAAEKAAAAAKAREEAAAQAAAEAAQAKAEAEIAAPEAAEEAPAEAEAAQADASPAAESEPAPAAEAGDAEKAE